MMNMMGGGGGMPATPDAAMSQPQVGQPQMSPVDHLRAAIEHAQAALVGEPNDGDSQQLAKAVQGLYAILTARQKESDSVMGMQPQLRRALGG